MAAPRRVLCAVVCVCVSFFLCVRVVDLDHYPSFRNTSSLGNSPPLHWRTCFTSVTTYLFFPLGWWEDSAAD